MSAARFDIEIEEKSNLTYEFIYRDSDGNPVDVSNYGAAVIFAKDYDSTPFASGNSVDGWVNVGDTDGSFILAVPYTAFHNLEVERGVWELYIYPTQGDPTDRPKRLIHGTFKFSKGLLDV